MKRSMFGNPRPKGSDEIRQAMNELGIDPAMCDVEIEHEGSDGFGNAGYCAEIVYYPDEDDERIELNTLAYERREALVNDLIDAGIHCVSIPGTA